MSATRYASATATGDSLLGTIESIIEPASLIISLWLVALYSHGAITSPCMALSLIVFALTFPGASRIEASVGKLALQVALSWGWLALLLLVGAYATHALSYFSVQFLATWFISAPCVLFITHFCVRQLAPAILSMQGGPQKVVIVGRNSQGMALADSIANARYPEMQLVGFFDDRDDRRFDVIDRYKSLGNVVDLAGYTKDNSIGLIFLSLPMAAEPRVMQILDVLKDTTASIYFVPDMFVTDLIQGRTASVNGIAVISVCETPFHGAMGLAKRTSDMVISLFIIALISPVLVGVAIAVKLSSPGPIIFRQKRYGLDGQKIEVYKFRSMFLDPKEQDVKQATRNDDRITRIGAFLRKTSLDELPQFINVLQGRMSIVGPRPHAVSHNELYRKLIKGYMVRHKVRPGITGWAQVNGFRGETDTLSKMQGRINYDLDYLRNWSLALDMRIILKTILLVFTDHTAY